MVNDDHKVVNVSNFLVSTNRYHRVYTDWLFDIFEPIKML